MAKIFKKLLSLTLTVILVASMLVTGLGSTVVAVGTTTVNGNTVYDEPFDLDFSDGLKTWLGIGSASNPKFVAEDGVLKAGSGFNTSWDEIGPARFKVPNVQVGDTIKFSFDLAINTDLGDQTLTDRVNSGERILWPLFRQYNAAGTKTDEQTFDVNKNHAGTVVSKAFTVADPNEFYRIIIRSANSLKNAWRISKLSVTVYGADGSVTVYPPVEVEEDPDEPEVPEEPTVEPNPPKNLDFSDGFNYWKGETSIYSAENGVLKTNDTYASGSWRWLKTEKFNIPNAVAGTTVKLTFDVEFEDGLPSMNGNANQQPTLDSTYGYKILDTYLYQYNADGTEKTNKRNEVFYNEEGTVTVGSITITDPAEEFAFHISCGNGAKKTWEVTNITVTATHPDGTVDTYPEPTDEPDEPVEPEEPTAPEDSEASYYDVDGKGIKSTNVEYPHQLKPVDQLANLDFEDGFRYWAGGKGKGTFASTAFNIVADGDNSYAAIPSTGYVSNFQTALFKLDGVSAGDEIVVIYDVKGEDGDKIRIKVEQEYVKSIAVYDATTGLNTTKKADGVTLINVTPGAPRVIVGTGTASSEFAAQLTDGWTTLIAASNNTLAAPSTGSAYTSDPIADAIYIKLLVTCGDAGVVAGDVIDAAVDNIRIAKVVGGVYTDVATGEVIYEDLSYGKVAMVGDAYFATLQEAVDAAVNGGTVELIADVELTDTLNIPANSTVTIDLNGMTISQTKEQTAGYQMILNDGNLTIEDTVGGGKISYTDSGNGDEYISDTIYNRGTIVINGGTIENLSSETVATNGYPHALDTYSGLRDTSVTINGGTIYCASYSAIRMFCVSATNKADLVINDGTIKGAVDMQNGTLATANGTLTVNGGTFEKTASRANIRFANWNSGATEYGISATVVDGTFDAGFQSTYVPEAANWNSKIITGGTFGVDVSDYCAEGFEAVENEDGTFGIEEEVVEEEDIFGIAFYIRNLPKPAEDKYQIAVFAGIDSLNYKAVGFRIYNADGVLLGQNTTKTVYSSITAGGTTIKASDYGCYRIFGVPVTFPVSYDDTTIYFEPFAVNFDDTEIVGNRVMIDDINTKY